MPVPCAALARPPPFEQPSTAIRRRAPLTRDAVTELLAITATLIDERKRIRLLLRRLPETSAEVRQMLNELARLVR